jgi:hypothetical protein
MQRRSTRSTLICVATATVSTIGISTAHAASLASDSASSSAYSSGFTTGTNGGTGFGPWNIAVTGTGGSYISGSTNDNTGVVTAPCFDVWNDTNDGNGGGEFGTDITTATRSFTGALSPDQVFKFSDVLHFANQTQGGGSALGWDLQDSSGNVLFDFHTAGGAPGYYLSDENNSDTVETTVPYNYQVGDTFAFELNDFSGDYTFTVSGAPNGNVTGGSQTFTGQISMTTGGPSQFAIYNDNGEGGSDIQFNALAVTSTAAPQQWISTTSGDWNNAANWSGIVPNAVGAEADFFSAITSNHTVFTDAAVTVGTINFNNANTYEITGTGSLTLQASTGDAEVIVQQGKQELDLPVTIASNTVFNVASGATLIVANPITIGSGLSLTQSGTGTVSYESIVSVASAASIAFSNATTAYELAVASGGKASIASPSGGVVVEVSNFVNAGTTDVANNELLIDYGSGADPIASIASQIASGYNHGSWNGAGIISSVAAVTPGYGLGYADSADPGNPAHLASGTIEIKYTLLGDANLDGVVNGIDFGILAANFNKGVTGWDKGDFNYDNVVNGIDFGELAANFNKGANDQAIGEPAYDDPAILAFAAANGLLADVPEPASISVLLLGSACILRRRRHRATV